MPARRRAPYLGRQLGDPSGHVIKDLSLLHLRGSDSAVTEGRSATPTDREPRPLRRRANPLLGRDPAPRRAGPTTPPRACWAHCASSPGLRTDHTLPRTGRTVPGVGLLHAPGLARGAHSLGSGVGRRLVTFSWAGLRTFSFRLWPSSDACVKGRRHETDGEGLLAPHAPQDEGQHSGRQLCGQWRRTAAQHPGHPVSQQPRSPVPEHPGLGTPGPLPPLCSRAEGPPCSAISSRVSPQGSMGPAQWDGRVPTAGRVRPQRRWGASAAAQRGPTSPAAGTPELAAENRTEPADPRPAQAGAGRESGPRSSSRTPLEGPAQGHSSVRVLPSHCRASQAITPCVRVPEQQARARLEPIVHKRL